MQIGFYFDQTRCIGCYSCVAACRSWQQLDQTTPDLIEITSQEGGHYPYPWLKHLFVTCFHCAKPACVPACPEGLLSKRTEDGIVIIADVESCIGCMLCVKACPYEAIKISSESKIVKCDLCITRIQKDSMTACIQACPTEAIEVGPMNILIDRYGQHRTLENFKDYRITQPSIIFRARNQEDHGLTS
jgi:anaerobic dimethyl sulfoxide reductase subunit B (iron-sulfur subunit)